MEKLNLDLFPRFELPESLSITEAPCLLEKEDLEKIIINKGIKKTIDYPNEVSFYEKNGKCPVVDFLIDIDNQKLKEKTLLNISLLAVQGKTAREPLVKYIKDGIYELRTIQSSNLTQIFYFFYHGNDIILTNGYIKKSQKLDEREFAKAKKYQNDYCKTKSK